MGFLDNIKSRIKSGDEGAAAEEQFQRGIREGSWPEGVDDFQLMDNTGNFLPNTPDVDPFAQVGQRGYMSDDPYQDEPVQEWSVVRAAGSSRASNLRVLEGGARQQDALSPRPPLDEEGVQVIDREESRAPRQRPASAPQKSYAERLRERVESAEPDFDAAAAIPQQLRNRPSENASADDIDSELASRRARRETAAQVPAPAAPAPAPVPDRPRESGKAPTLSADALVVRARSYDDVRLVASGLLTEHRPVAISTRGCSDSNAQRILDFSFGLCCATGAGMQELAPKLYAVVPRGTSVSDASMADLKRQGLLR